MVGKARIATTVVVMQFEANPGRVSRAAPGEGDLSSDDFPVRLLLLFGSPESWLVDIDRAAVLLEGLIARPRVCTLRRRDWVCGSTSGTATGCDA